MPGKFLSRRSACVLLVFVLFAPAAPARAGHPLGTEDAATRGKGNAEEELNYERSSAGGEEDGRPPER